MKLFHLYPIADGTARDGKSPGVLVRAESPEQARRQARDQVADPDRDVWADDTASLCVELVPGGPAGILMTGYEAAANAGIG